MASTIVRRRPYKDFLQPALHRRFSVSVWILLGLSYLEAIVLSSWSSFLWTWFPIGPTGIRAVFLAVSALPVVILRIAQYHVGQRTSDSAFQTFTQNVLKFQTAEALVTYVFSAYIFSQVYLLSLPDSAGLEWITHFSADRARLNEKAVFFTVHFIILGVSQAAYHLFKDSDRLSLGVTKPREGPSKNLGDTTTQWKLLWAQAPNIIVSTLNQSIIGLVLSTIIYPLFLRTTVWRTMLLFLRPIYNLPRTNMVPLSYPFSFSTLLRCWTASLFVVFAWTVGNMAFSIFLVKEPLKNGKPLTSESKDPNGSLLNGLKSKKLAIKAFSTWELAFIANDFPERRSAIYEDIDRKDGPMWTQVYAICLETLKDMESRIDSFGKAPEAAPPVKAEPTEAEERKRIAPPPKEDPIFQSTPQKKSFRGEVEKTLNHVVTSPNQGSQLSPVAKKALASAKQQLLQAQKAATGSEDPQSFVQDIAFKVLKLPIGWPFRQEYNRRLNKAILGAPFGEPSLLINATNALGQLAVRSLKEDKYGNVQRDVAAIIRTLTTVTKKLDTFKSTLSISWTDVECNKESPEVDMVLKALKETLQDLVEAFEPYARDLRLTRTDVRLAKEAAPVPPPPAAKNTASVSDEQEEMRQVR